MKITKELYDGKDKYTAAVLKGIDVHKWFVEQEIPFVLITMHEAITIGSRQQSTHTISASAAPMDEFPAMLQYMLALYHSDTLKDIFAELMRDDSELYRIVQEEINEALETKDIKNRLFVERLADDFGAEAIAKAKKGFDEEEEDGSESDE